MTMEEEREDYYRQENHTLRSENLSLSIKVDELEEQIRELKELNNQYYNQIRQPIFDPLSGTCSDCDENIEQYKKMRSAFDRRKNQHQAIRTYFEHYHVEHHGKPITLTKIIKIGEHILYR